MTIDSPRNINGVVGIRQSITSILISVGSLVLSLVIVSLFVFSYPTTSSQFGYIISAGKLEAPPVVSDKEIQFLSNGGTPSENVKQDLVTQNPLIENEPGSNETLSIIKDPLTKNENSTSDESHSDSKEVSPEGELSAKNDQGVILFLLNLSFCFILFTCM